MNKLLLTLYSRQQCCICEGLEERLRSISLTELHPPLELRIIDIDDKETPKLIKDQYDLEVPVMVLGSIDSKKIFQLPRVSPRLNEDGLFEWLQKIITKSLISE